MCRKERLLELLHDFVLFEGGIKKLPRVHQYFGSKAAQEHVKVYKGGIIWHTQGSGKSIVMVLLAKWILENKSKARVLMLTDRRMQRLDQASLRALAEACTRYEKAEHQELAGDAIPPEFRSLKPVRVSFYPGLSEIALLERGDSLYVFLRVDTNAENQIIEGVSSGRGPQHQQRLWERNPKVTRRLQPAGRTLTVRQGSMAHCTDWIVRPEELLVIERPGTVGGTDEILERIPLTPAQREAIEAGARAISAESRGLRYDGGGSDGTQLTISFTDDGSRADDYELSNTWRDEAGPLLDAINQIVRKDDQITFRERESNRPPEFKAYQDALTWQEFDRRWYAVRIPWWCLWPRLGIAEN